MGDETNGRLADDVSETKAAQVAIKNILARMESILMLVSQGQARLEGRLTEVLTVRDVGNLEGQMIQLGQRIGDIRARLPAGSP